MNNVLRTTGLVIFLGTAMSASAQDSYHVTVPASTGTVMGDTTTLSLIVTNDPTSPDRAGWAFAGLNTAAYTVVGGTAPTGWTVENIDGFGNISFVPVSPCSTNSVAPGASASFGFVVTAQAAAADVTDQFTTGGVTTCGQTQWFFLTGTQPTWTRHGLSASLSVAPITVGPGSTVTVTMTVTNRTTQTQNPIAPVALTVTGTPTATLTSGPSPANRSLAAGSTGTFTWTYTMGGSGTATFQGSAANGTTATSLPVSATTTVSSLADVLSVVPLSTTSGGPVTITMSVTNNSSSAVTGVTPSSLASIGSATISSLSGPTPATIASLAAGASGTFQWTCNVIGSAGQTYQFQASASATQSGSTINGNTAVSPAGAIVVITMTASRSYVTSGSGTTTESFTVVNLSGQSVSQLVITNPAPGVWVNASNPFVNDASGWTSAVSGTSYTWNSPSAANDLASGASKTFSVTFSSVGPVSTTTAYYWVGVVTARTSGNLFQATAGPTTVVVPQTPSDITVFTATSGNAQNTLYWNNPAGTSGVLILRAAVASPNTNPVNQIVYTVNQSLGNATVIFANQGSIFSDTGLTNGTKYFYKAYAYDANYTYASGNVPSSSGLFSIPTTRVSPSPQWCYSVGSSSLQQPSADLGVGVFTASASGAVSANVTSTSSASTDGSERWRPAQLAGAVQNRFPVVPRQGSIGNYIYTGDMGGKASCINAQTGAVVWSGNGGAALGDTIQAQPGVQLNQYANAAFQAANPGRDLIFFGTRNTGVNSARDNKVYALSSVNGSVVWTFNPGNMDIINGGPRVDYTNNQVWFSSRSNGGTQPSLWILNTLTGALLKSLSLGDIDFPPIGDGSGQIYIADNTGTVYGLNLSGVSLWNYSVCQGHPSCTGLYSYPFPTGNSFVASVRAKCDWTAGGSVRFYTVSGTTVTQSWCTNIATPTTVRIDATNQTIYTGSSDGNVYKLRASDGTILSQIAVSNSQVGAPSIDMTAGRMHVGTLDGRICAFSWPF